MDIKTELKKLILDERFTDLQSLVNQEINLMEILNVAHKELQHSNFLAWLFDPKGTHSLKDYFIKEFIKIYYKENDFNDLGYESGLSVFDFVKLDLTDLIVKREHKNIDILLISEKNQLFILIENKIFSQERKGQLERYRQYAEKEFEKYKYKIFIYLSLYDQNITEDEKERYTQISYDHIIKLIENTSKANISENVHFVLSQYIKSINSIMKENEQIEELVKQLYEEYKSSFDLVYKYIKPTKVNGKYLGRVPNNLEDLIKNESLTISIIRVSNAAIEIVPKFLEKMLPKLIEKGYITENYNLERDRLFSFVFEIKDDIIKFLFRIGDYENQEVRKRILQIYKRHSDYLDKVNKRLAEHWHSCLTITLVQLPDGNDEDENIEDIDTNSEIEKNFKKIIHEDLPKIEKIINELVE